MSEREWAALLSVAAISGIGVLGAALLLRGRSVARILPLLVALAAGALLGDTFLHLLPHAVHAAGGFTPAIGWGLLGGLVGFFLVENLLHWHHHGEDLDDHGPEGVHSFGWMNLIGDAIHNWIDGALVAGAWLVSEEAGLATTVAVLLHEIPQEFGDMGVLLHAGFKPRRALLLNLLSAAAAFLGAGLVLVLDAGTGIAEMLVPVAAGGFLYIACADLVPELHRRAKGKTRFATWAALLLGLALMAALGALEGHDHGHGPSTHPTHGPNDGHGHACLLDDGGILS